MKSVVLTNLSDCGLNLISKGSSKKFFLSFRTCLRKYSASNSMPRVLNGLGVSIVSTSKGVVTGKQATQMNVGGEVLCYVY